MRAQLDPRVRERSPGALAAAARERAHVLGHVDRLGAGLARELDQLALGRAAADHEPGPAVAQLAVEIGEALEQELRPRPGGVPAVQQAVVEAEDRDDPIVVVERRPQGRVVANPQVAPEPDDRGVGQPSLATSTTSLDAVSMTPSAR